MDPLLWICNLTMGICVAGISYTCRGNYALAIDLVERDLNERLRGIRSASAHLRRWVNTWVVIVAAVFFVLWLGLNSLPFAVLEAVFLIAAPWYLIRRMGQRRRQKIEDQLADAMVMFSSAVRAGLSLAQSLELLANDCPRPIQQEFQQIVGEYKLGKPLERTLTEAKQRLRSENFVLFAAALLASRESGGRLNETVERIGKSVLEIQRLERKVRSETAQARKSAVYMAIAPGFILFFYYIIDPGAVRILFEELPGQMLLSLAVVLNIAAYVWAVKILRADI